MPSANRAWRLVDGSLPCPAREAGRSLSADARPAPPGGKVAGQPDFRAYKWQELARFDYTPADCFTFHDAIEHEVVPLAHKIYAEQARKLGLATLRPWDTEVDPHGEPLRPFNEVAELEEGCRRIFEQVDPELAAHFAVMRDGFLDLPSRAQQGGRRVLRSVPGHRQAVHLHERRRHP